MLLSLLNGIIAEKNKSTNSVLRKKARSVEKMYQNFSKEEMEECCKAPDFCVVCLCKGENVIDHICEYCRGD